MAGGEKKPHLVTTRLSESALRKLEQESARQDRTRSDVMRRLLERALSCPAEECSDDE